MSLVGVETAVAAWSWAFSGGVVAVHQWLIWARAVMLHLPRIFGAWSDLQIPAIFWAIGLALLLTLPKDRPSD